MRSVCAAACKLYATLGVRSLGSECSASGTPPCCVKFCPPAVRWPWDRIYHYLPHLCCRVAARVLPGRRRGAARDCQGAARVLPGRCRGLPGRCQGAAGVPPGRCQGAPGSRPPRGPSPRAPQRSLRGPEIPRMSQRGPPEVPQNSPESSAQACPGTGFNTPVLC